MLLLFPQTQAQGARLRPSTEVATPRRLPIPCPRPAVLLGGAAGYCLARLLHMRPSSIISIAAAAGSMHPTGGGAVPAVGHPTEPRALARFLRHPGVARLRPLAPLAVSGLTFAAAGAMGAEPLLACVAAGLVASNWR